MRSLGVACLVFLFFSTCQEKRTYEDQRDFKAREWYAVDTARFSFTIVNPALKFDLSCNLRNSIDYPYARLFLQYTLKDSLGHQLEKKLVSEYLFDGKTGEPRGTSGLGDVYDHEFLLDKSFEFKKSGTYIAEFEQFMRLDTLPGVLSIGFRVAPEAAKK
jgi:gliding motility-associated lipoprotein GldH